MTGAGASGEVETAAPRPGEALPVEALGEWLAGKLPGADPLVIEQFPAGHSNLTYLLRSGGSEYVLRRPPLGPVAPKAHDMVREARVLAAVHPHYPPAPSVVLACEDPTVIGAPFFVMERRRGVVVRHGLPRGLADLPDAASRVSGTLIEGLAQLHSIDIQATGLVALGKPEGFLERQVAGWSDRWYRARTEPLPAMDRVIGWLEAECPVSRQATVVHQDYKLDNVMLAEGDPDRLAAVLDWEMATVGDPLADLGLTLTYWSLPEARSVSGIGTGDGWWPRERMITRYAERTGFDVGGLRWYEVLGVFKLAVIVQQIYARWVRGQTTDSRFEGMGRQVAALVAAAGQTAGSQ
jgi:aminoglycoside phosphotransferase (APT) family kinase protein